jgi:hypothetical protein
MIVSELLLSKTPPDMGDIHPPTLAAPTPNTLVQAIPARSSIRKHLRLVSALFHFTPCWLGTNIIQENYFSSPFAPINHHY